MKNLDGKEVSRQAIITVMRQEIANCIDGCNEVNCTQLAEITAQQLNLYTDNRTYTIPEEVFDIAVEVSEQR